MKLQTQIRAIVAYGSLLLTTACVPSLYPLYTDDDVVFDPAVVGTWIDDDDATWTLEERSSGHGYRLTIVEEDVSMDFAARLVRLGEYRFLDIYPEDDSRDDFLGSHFVAAHTFWKLSIEDETMRLVGLNPDWLADGLEDGTVQLTYSRWGHDGDDVLLTAKTRELQEFIVAHAENAEAFDTVVRLHRRQQLGS